MKIARELKPHPLIKRILMIIVGASIVHLSALGQHDNYFTSNGKRIDISEFNLEVERLMADVGVPGMSLAIIENGQIVFFNGYGHKTAGRKGSVDRRTIFEACSLSKTFLVKAALQMVDEGKLDLDKPLYEYLEWEQLKHDPRYKLITSRMVLSHSSGIENWRTDNCSDTLEIVRTPGEKFIYSGEGFRYLAKVLEKILDQSYRKYVHERVIAPLHLKRSFTSYRLNGLYPFNYAVAHSSLGEPKDKFKNWNTNAAAGNHTTAYDYAKLVLSIFEGNDISKKTRKEVLTPMVVVPPARSRVYFGPGFEIVHTQNDTIIAHGGDNDGFKANMFYSVVQRRGFVMMMNSDLGKVMSGRVNEMTAGLEISSYYDRLPFDQYPCPATQLLNVYRQRGVEPMFEEIEVMKGLDKISVNTMIELADVFINRDMGVSKRLVDRNLAFFPRSPLAHLFEGYFCLKAGNYKVAMDELNRANELGFDLWEMDDDFKNCNRQLKDAQIREVRITKVGENTATTIQAEDYNVMYGIQVQETADEGGGDNVGYIETGDWLDYSIEVTSPGTYYVNFRVSSLPGGGRLELRSGESILTSIDIGSTRAWQKWTTITSRVSLLPGVQTIRVYAGIGDFAFNWMRFSSESISLNSR
jgi:CubicO group peptidase (beta-lactamase class C family)